MSEQLGKATQRFVKVTKQTINQVMSMLFVHLCNIFYSVYFKLVYKPNRANSLHPPYQVFALLNQDESENQVIPSIE